MRPLPSLLAVLAVAATLNCGDAQAQARGPSAEEVRENGQLVLSRRAQLVLEIQQEALLDDAAHAVRIAELETWLRRLVGRFRIDGQIESDHNDPPGRTSAKPTGVADCVEVGEGAGIQCILNASWDFFETPSLLQQVALPPAEALNTIRPALFVLGINQSPLGIRSMMVPADSVAHSWVGRLKENTLNSTDESQELGSDPYAPVEAGFYTDAVSETLYGPTDIAEYPTICTDRCLPWFEVIARPGSDIVTFQFDRGDVLLKFIMHRDADATIDKPLRQLKAR